MRRNHKQDEQYRRDFRRFFFFFLNGETEKASDNDITNIRKCLSLKKNKPLRHTLKYYTQTATIMRLFGPIYLDLTSHSGLYEAMTCAIANPSTNPGPYPTAIAFQFNTCSSSSGGCCVGGALVPKQVSLRGRPQSPAFPSNEDLACPVICVPCGIPPLSWL